jgi:hypothetical protein
LFSPRRKETVGPDYHHGVFRVLVNPVLVVQPGAAFVQAAVVA